MKITNLFSQETASRARKNETLILKGIGQTGQNRIADHLKIHESTLSKFKEEKLKLFAKLITLAGLKVVPITHKCYDPKYIASLEYILGKKLEPDKEPLMWEDDAA